ncbi:MAG: DUF370 domain-containing protein [Lachnospiraceae bacterium]|nr:DUF370 domain-containing protein [Lachnospiraceae bacterium]
MDALINIGFGNMVSKSKVVAVISPDSAPSKRLVQKSRDEGLTIDATLGRKTKSLIITSDGYLVLSALLPETIAGRFNDTTFAVNERVKGKGEKNA